MSLWVRGVPPGFAYMGHSLCSGGSSAAEAIGISHFKGNWSGGWSQTGRTRERHHIYVVAFSSFLGKFPN